VAIYFDGNDDQIFLKTNNLNNTNNFTITVWIKPYSIRSYAGIVTSRDSDFQGLLISGSTNQELTYDWEGTVDEYDASTLLFLSINAWNFCSCVITPSKATVFLLDGKNNFSKFTNTKTHNTKSPHNWLVGHDNDNFHYNGLMSNLCFYNTSLLDNEIEFLARSREKFLFNRNLILNLSMDDFPQGKTAHNQTIFDRSGNSNIGTGTRGINNANLTYKSEDLLTYHGVLNQI